MDNDEEDYVFCGTPIEREEDISCRKKKSLAESSGQLRSLPPWKQEVLDEDGRRRFHGAFTGGFSAGFYNTVGSKEGWTPQSFTSTRKNRADVKKQSILNFLDDDEKADMDGHSLGASHGFDTFGFTAIEIARKQTEKEQQQRPSAIPGPVPDELVLPATKSIGVKLLMKMGWRHGHAILDSRSNSLYDARREGRKAFLALSSDNLKIKQADSDYLKSDVETEMGPSVNDDVKSSQSAPVYVLNPKQDLHGLGFDPFKYAPEFREKKESRMTVNKKTRYHEALLKKDNLLAFKSGKVGPGFGIGALEEVDDEDEDVYASGYDFGHTFVQEIEEPSSLNTGDTKMLAWKDKNILPGFKIASELEYQLERFDHPIIPKEFEPYHSFPAPLQSVYKHDDLVPPEVSPPDDYSLKVLIEGVATLVGRHGKEYEDLSRGKNLSNPLFCFLIGGNGCDYYARKLWEERQKHLDHTKPQFIEKSSQNLPKLTAETRAKLLGEKPLEGSTKDSNSPVVSADMVQLQFSLTDTFTKPASHNELREVAKPFNDEPAKQERFELFLKEKYHGGLRSTDSGRASNMSEAARAREKLDFEAAAETMERGKWVNDVSAQHFVDILPIGGMQFTPGRVVAEDLTMKKVLPKREEFQWRPTPILCKRFDISDPYLGKAPPPPRLRSKMDSLIFTCDSTQDSKESSLNNNAETPSVSQPDAQMLYEEASVMEPELSLEVENVERPVDLYKAIFSDNSDIDEETNTSPKDTQKESEVANKTLNRLIAGDFLDSLGKELGLDVPPDLPILKTNTNPKSYNRIQTSDVDKDSRDPDSYKKTPTSDQEVIKSKTTTTKHCRNQSEDGKRRRRRHPGSDSDSESMSDYGEHSHSHSRSKMKVRREVDHERKSRSKKRSKHSHRHHRSRRSGGKERVDVKREERKRDG